MIEHLRGIILSKETGHAVIEAGGVGYGVDAAPRTIAAMGATGEEARVWIHTVVKEDALDLYAFESRAEREVFGILIGISGLGPKMGLAILGQFSLDQIIQIVLVGDTKRLSGVPGIGPKRAEKLLVELKGKVKQLSIGLGAERMAELHSGAAAVDATFAPAALEAVAALESLGINPAQARKAMAMALEILGEGTDTEALVREGLKHRHI